MDSFFLALFWLWWLAAILKLKPWIVASGFWYRRFGPRGPHFYTDWGFLFFAPLLILIDHWLRLSARVTVVVTITVATTIWRWRSHGSWRAYEPPLPSGGRKARTDGSDTTKPQS